MAKFMRRGFRIAFPITVLIALLTAIWIGQCFQLDPSRLQLETAAEFNDGWRVVSRRGSLSMDEVPRALTVDSNALILRNTLPEFHCGNHALCFRTNNERVRVSVDGETIYTYGYNDDADFGRYYGTVWNMVPLEASMSGAGLTIELHALSDEKHMDSYTFYLDNRNTIIVTLILNNWLLFINCLICTAVGLILLGSGILYMNTRAASGTAKARIYLGVFVLTSQIYAFSDGGFLQFFIDNKAVTHFIVHASLMLMPAPFTLYLAEVFPRWRKEYRILGLLFCGYFLLRLALYIGGIAEINQMLAFTHALILLALMYATVLCIADTSSAISRIMLAGIIAFFLCVLGTILCYYTVPHLEARFPLYTLAFGLGIDLLIAFFYSALLRSTLSTASHALIYEHQAYTDALTQVNNRAAFNILKDRLEPADYPRLTLFMVDLNNLKQVNDTLGHPAGDQLICTLVQCLKSAFGDMGKIYRYGGDEFIVLIEDAGRDEMHAAQAAFDQLLAEHSLHSGQEISVAVGMATRQDKQCARMHLSELLNLADMAMYQIKAEQKTAPASVQAVRHQRLEQIDSTTGILSFAAFKTDVYNALMAGEAQCPCIITFDLNFFDGYNNLFGWEAGNRLLMQMTDLALKLCGERGFCAHGDADTFWVFTDMPDPDALTARIADETRRFQAQLGDCLLFPSFGIYYIHERTLPVSDMCSRATSAKKRIKGRLDVICTIYSTEEHQRRIDNMELISYMQKGLDGEEFIPYYQPKFRCSDGSLAGAEALARWPRSPEKAASAAEFTALFEKSGLILKLDWYMLEKTCALLRRLMDAGLECVPVSNNFSRLHVYEEDCVQRLNRVVDDYGIPHGLIEIELTETALVQDSNRILQLIAGLQADGFKVSLDDFGSGVSSLGSLNSIRVDTIKIDRSLIETPADAPADNAIFEFVVQLCRRLQIHTLAEGVETRAQMDRLKRCGCDMVQGNLFSPPMRQEDFIRLITEQQPKPV